MSGEGGGDFAGGVHADLAGDGDEFGGWRERDGGDVGVGWGGGVDVGGVGELSLRVGGGVGHLGKGYWRGMGGKGSGGSARERHWLSLIKIVFVSV